jgi:hypothetical protein
MSPSHDVTDKLVKLALALEVVHIYLGMEPPEEQTTAYCCCSG